MEKIRVLLICGTGASSGFMASSIRNAGKKRNIDLEITARSESEIENYIEDTDCVMIAPHLAYILDEISDYEKDYNVKFIQMKQSYYATLNGEEALDHLLQEMEIS